VTSRHRRQPPEPVVVATEEKLAIAENALLDHRAVDPIVLDMRDLTIITDYFLICHGTSSVHIRALADAVLEALETRQVRPSGMEGYREGQWVLIDYGDLVVHIFDAQAREFYSLERLWSDAPQTTLSAAQPT